MKKSFLIILSAVLIGLSPAVGQFNPIKSFDYSMLEGKVLLIPTYDVAKSYQKRMAKKGKLDKIKDAKERADSYNKMWKEAMAESSYDATDYEIRPFDRKKLMKSKDPKSIVLYYYTDEYYNKSAILMVTGPKRKVIARCIITGLDLWDKNDVRLMINMLNESLSTAAQLEEEGDKSRKAIKTKYMEGVVSFFDDIDNKTFLVPKSDHKNEKKRKKRTEELEEILKSWTLSKASLVTAEEINKKRTNADPNSYYWRRFPIYTNSPLITYNYNLIISTEGDNVIYGFLGKKRMKPSTIKKIEKVMVNKADKYRKKLAN